MQGERLGSADFDAFGKLHIVAATNASCSALLYFVFVFPAPSAKRPHVSIADTPAVFVSRQYHGVASFCVDVSADDRAAHFVFLSALSMKRILHKFTLVNTRDKP